MIALRDPYDETSEPWDIAILTAADYDRSPVTAVDGVGSGIDADVIKSYLFDFPTWTVRTVVGMFGIKGKYRVLEE